MRKVFIIFCLFSNLALFCDRAEAGDSFKVVELFTSQGCSSCPPADDFLNTLAGRKDIIALSCHVTYWNHLRWKDTLSREFCTARQKSYASFLRSRRVYTPQMIVNGTAEFVGSRRTEVEQALRRASAVPEIPLRKLANGEIEIFLPAVGGGANTYYGLWVFGYRAEHTENITAGENRGHKITSAQAVLYSDHLGAWNGQAERRLLPPVAGVDGLVILAQTRDFGAVAAAGKIGLR